jgi:hypothetical protein
MGSQAEVAKAIAEFDGTKLDGRTLKVMVARIRSRGWFHPDSG